MSLQEPQKLYLEIQSGLSYLIQEYSPAACGLDQTFLSGSHGSGERTALITEKLRLQKFVGYRSAVYGYEWFVRPGGVLVYELRHFLLADSGFSQYQNGGLERRYLLSQGDDLSHLLAYGHQSAFLLYVVRVVIGKSVCVHLGNSPGLQQFLSQIVYFRYVSGVNYYLLDLSVFIENRPSGYHNVPSGFNHLTFGDSLLFFDDYARYRGRHPYRIIQLLHGMPYQVAQRYLSYSFVGLIYIKHIGIFVGHQYTVKRAFQYLFQFF